MDLETVEGENWLGFPDAFRWEPTPITLVLGRNSAGKSALCRTPAFIAQLFLGGDELGLGRDAPVARRHAELAFGGSGAWRLGAGWSDGHKLHVRGVERSGELRLEAVTVERSGETLLDERRISFGSASSALAQVDAIVGWARDVHVLADRDLPDSIEPIPARWVGADGRDTAAVLLRWQREDPNLAALNGWLAKHLNVTIEVLTVGDRPEIRVRSPVGATLALPLSKVGTGVREALPVVVALLDPHSAVGTLSVEHPELHLQPAVHRAIADLLVTAAQRGRRLIVESHSEILWLQLRLAVADGRLTPEQLSIWFIETGQHGATPVRCELDGGGTQSRWPAGVFADAHMVLGAIRAEQARRERRTG